MWSPICGSPPNALLASCWTWAGDAVPALREASPLPLQTRLAAVAEGGWNGVGFVHADLEIIDGTIGFAELARRVAGAGLSFVEVEFLTDWWATGPRRAISDEQRSRLLRAADALGACTMKVGGDLSTLPPQADLFALAFDDLATEAAEHGVRVAIEPMPMNNLKSLTGGIDFIREVGNPNGGLCIDAPHVIRGGTDYAELPRLLRPEEIFVVELADGTVQPAADTAWGEAVDHKLYPGEGELRVADFVAQMMQLGWSGPWGVEITSIAHRATPLDKGLSNARTATLSVIAAAQQRLASLSPSPKLSERTPCA